MRTHVRSLDSVAVVADLGADDQTKPGAAKGMVRVMYVAALAI